MNKYLHWGVGIVIVLLSLVGIWTIGSARSVHLGLGGRPLWRPYVLRLGHTLDTATLRAVGVLELDVLLSAISTLIEALILGSLVLLVKSLDSTGCFGASHQILLIERVIQVLNSWSPSCIWRLHSIRLSWIGPISLSLARSVPSTTSSSLASAIPVLLSHIHDRIHGIVKQTILVLGLLGDHRRLGDVGNLILVYCITPFATWGFYTERGSHLFLALIIMGKVFVDWDLLHQHVFLTCRDQVAVVVQDHVLGWRIDTATVIVIMYGSNFIPGLLLLSIINGRIIQLTLILFMFNCSRIL